MKYRIGIAVAIMILVVSIIVFDLGARNENSTEALNSSELYESVNDQTEVRIESPDGQIIQLEVAKSPAKRAQGLMFIEELEENTGMLFVFEDEVIRNFHMLNTYISLDMIFLDKDLRVVTIHENTKTLQTEELYWSTEPAKHVIEMESGWVRDNNVSIGDKFKLISYETE
jgi:hypothetical protein